MDYDFTVKTILIGDSSVGKSSLLYRYTDNDWNPYYIATIGVDFKVTTIEKQGKVIKLQLWDTAGQERFRSITQSYYKNANAIAVVFDVTDRDSFNNVATWIEDIHNFGATNVPVALLGNKCDFPASQRVISAEEANAFAAAHGIKYFETSAKTGTNVQEAFEHIVDACISQKSKVIAPRTRNNVILPRDLGKTKDGKTKDNGPCDGGC